MNSKWCDDEKTWDKQVNLWSGHPLQLWAWGQVKSRHNWRAYRLLVEQEGQVVGGASLLVRSFPGPIPPLVYVARGPFGDNAKRVEILEQIKTAVKQRFKPLALSIEPEWFEFPKLSRWRKATNTITVPKTGLIDISRPDDELLADMSKKTRQYINKSAKAGIEVKPVESETDLASCLEIYHQTADRAGFALHSDSYYQDIFASLGAANLLYAAWADGQIVAFLWVAASDTTAFELYGGVNQVGQDLRANYTLKWQVIAESKKRGISRYDLNGLLNDGISNFKRGFITEDTEFIGTYDYPMSVWYWPYSRGLPMAKKIVRLIKR